MSKAKTAVTVAVITTTLINTVYKKLFLEIMTMKKMLSILVVLILVLSIGSMAFAANSPTASQTTTTGTKTSDKPTEVDSNYTKIVGYNELDQLAAEDQETFKDAKKAVKDATPDGYSCRYIFWAEAGSYPYEAKYEISTLAASKGVAVKLYADNAWQELESANNGDGTITATVTGAGPVAIFVEK